MSNVWKIRHPAGDVFESTREDCIATCKAECKADPRRRFTVKRNRDMGEWIGQCFTTPAPVVVTEADIAESMCGPVGPLMICVCCDDRSNTPMESDAFNFKCPSCGEHGWCSVEELLVRGLVVVS